MPDFCVQYVTYFDRLLIEGVKWLADNEYLYYVVMCLVIVIIQMKRGLNDE